MPILAHVVWGMAHCHPRVFDLLQRHFLLCRCFGGRELLGVRQKDGNNSIGKLGKPIQKPKPQGNTQGISRISSISCLSMSRILICTLPSGVKPGVLENPPWLLRVEFWDSPCRHFRGWLEVPTIFKAYVEGMCKGMSPQSMPWSGNRYWYNGCAKHLRNDRVLSNGRNIINGWINNTHFSDKPNSNPLYLRCSNPWFCSMAPIFRDFSMIFPPVLKGSFPSRFPIWKMVDPNNFLPVGIRFVPENMRGQVASTGFSPVSCVSSASLTGSGAEISLGFGRKTGTIPLGN